MTDTTRDMGPSRAPHRRPRPERRGQTASAPTDRTGGVSARSARVAEPVRKPPFIILLFVASLLLPSSFSVGPLDLSIYRMILLVMFIPCLVQWVSDKTGPVKGIDFLIFGHSIWIFIALLVVHGMDRWETAGISTVETIGAYLLARVYVRTPDDFYYFIKCLCMGVVLMLPFAFIETATSRIPINEIMGTFSTVNPDLMDEMRFGLHRVQGPFEHPILFGVFCAALFSPSFLIWGYGLSKGQKFLRASVPLVATFLSLSMGAYISLFIQGALLMWNYILRNVPGRWLYLFLIFLSIYIVLDILSNRSPVQIFISYMTFNSGASYNRILIWEYGSAEVLRHPIFGIGFNDWVRPHWMVPSIDNFWLITAMTYGLPALGFLVSAFVVTILRTGLLDLTGDPRVASYRMAYLVSIGGFMLSICTVHVWNASYVFLIFLLGSGVWMRDHVVAGGALDDAGEGTGGRRRARGSGSMRKKSPRKRLSKEEARQITRTSRQRS